jgi:dipeptidyl aminopeptidase/acylaminoacyl peptidase
MTRIGLGFSIRLLVPTLLLLFGVFDTACGADRYQKPPKNVTDILDALPPPIALESPTRQQLLMLQPVPNPPIADLAEPMLRLAGHRINPRTNGLARPPRFTISGFIDVATGKLHKVALPADFRPDFFFSPFRQSSGPPPGWSADGKQLAVCNVAATGLELWLVDTKTYQAKQIPNVRLNGTYGKPFLWMPDNRALLCRTVRADRGEPPASSNIPAGPTIQESSGKEAPVRTYQDLLKNPHDEELFDYYFTSQLVLIDTQSGQVSPIGKPAIFSTTEVSPDGERILVAYEHRPYSYLHPSFAFPRELEAWSRRGEVEFKLASLPLAEQVPIEGVPTGARDYHWRSTEPATLVWAEALDGGDPRTKAPHRDRIMMLKSPFKDQPHEVAKTQHRVMELLWGEQPSLALVKDFDRDSRHQRTFVINVDHPEQSARLLWDRSVRDRYRDPGTPEMKTLPSGHSVICQKSDFIYLNGQGASPSGDHPFLDRFDLVSGKTERLFQSDPDSYESVVMLVDDEKPSFVTRRESLKEPPNYYLRAGGNSKQVLTNYQDPSPVLRSIKKQLVTYKRADGVQLSFTLYLPPDHKLGQRLPTIVWAYPLEFNDPATAGQVTGSPNHFTTIGGISHLFLLTQGYAVLDNATMPVVGDPETVNNTYIEQIVASAAAAIDKAVEMGIADRNRVGVGGHSYGAFMTANLLAHSNLFKAGVARSGAYNRTLTPFGFQSERRTLWQAPDVYVRVSPFMYAHKIKAPILLIHGEADNNAGTFPVQSERMYQAIKGNGGTVRYVSLPLESHGYVARESVEHTLYEMISWFDRYIKNAPESHDKP